MNNLNKYSKISIVCLLAIIVMVPTGLFFVLAPIFALACLVFIASTSVNIILSLIKFKNLDSAQRWTLLIWVIALALFFVALYKPEFRDFVLGLLF